MKYQSDERNYRETRKDNTDSDKNIYATKIILMQMWESQLIVLIDSVTILRLYDYVK